MRYGEDFTCLMAKEVRLENMQVGVYSCSDRYRTSSAELESLMSVWKSAIVTAWLPNDIFKSCETLVVLKI